MRLSRDDYHMHFFYDAQNKPAVVSFNGTAYAYLYNLQGDVIAILDGSGNKVVEYAYDAWGKHSCKAGALAARWGRSCLLGYREYVDEMKEDHTYERE